MRKRCPQCALVAEGTDDIERLFGFRMVNGVRRPQSYCRTCRSAAPRHATGTTRATMPSTVPCTPEELAAILTAPASANTAAIEPRAPLAFHYINRVSVELEGGWNANAANCRHVHVQPSSYDRGCYSACSHVCSTSLVCARTCTHEGTCSCCSHRHTNACYMCQHEHETGDSLTACQQLRCQHRHDQTCLNLSGFHRDASVGRSRVTGMSTDLHNRANVLGEVAIPRAELNRYGDSMDHLLEWVTANAPHEIDETCGTHFHASVRSDGDYAILAEGNGQRFYAFFKVRLLQWVDANVTTASIRAKIMSRIEGQNPYCCPNDRTTCLHGANAHSTRAQMAQTGYGSDARYAHLNFCKSKHGTIECRVFHGMKTPSVIVSAAECYFRAIEDYLAMVHAERGTRSRQTATV